MKGSSLANHCLNVLEQVDSTLPNAFAAACNLFDMIPASIYWKNSQGIYLGRNEYAAKKMHALKFEEHYSKDFVVGKTDDDFFDKNTAEGFLENDQTLLSGRVDSHQFIENFLLPNGEATELISTKKLFYDHKDKPLVVGCTIDLIEVKKIIQFKNQSVNELMTHFQSFMLIPDMKSLSDLVKAIRRTAILLEATHELRKVLQLTDRELACYCLLVRNVSAKQIGQFLNISHRTVEVFIDRVKKKLNISCKSQLIDWFWKSLAV